MSFINFESARDKDRARKELREAREQMLQEAKQGAKKRAERETQKILSGEKNWMLPDVASKFDKPSSSKKVKKKDKKSKKSSSQKKRKRKYSGSKDSDSETEENSSEDDQRYKNGKMKKSKKKRKHKKHSKTSSSSESSNDEDKINTETWIEKTRCDEPLQRDNWMMDASKFNMKTFTRDGNEPKKGNDEKPTETYNPATSARELNPHWKTTGTGLPSFQKPRDFSDDEETKGQSIQKSTGSSGWRKKSAAYGVKRQEATKKHSSSSSGSDSASKNYEDPKYTDNTSTSNAMSSCDFLTDQQMNELSAKILKAEILGNSEVVAKLKIKLEKAREQRNAIKESKTHDLQKPIQTSSKKKKEEHVVLTRTDTQGNVCPLQASQDKGSFDSRELYGGRRNLKKSGKRTETHVDGERVRYFPDDDKYDIKQMFEREKYTTAAEANLQFANIASKHKNPNDDLEDIFVDKISKSISERDIEKRDIERAINAHEKLEAQLDNCERCLDSHKINKSLILCMAEKIYLALPWHIGLQAGHCIIVSTQHISCSTQLDEDSWEEVENFRKALTQMFAAQRKDVIFFEIANKLHRRPHLSIHCIPIPMSQGESAPFYFKKAIEESEQEWSINKQLVRLSSKKGLRNSIPIGLPYFWVQFGVDSGFAHVIEDQDRFPTNFAVEIIGGMLNLDPSKWRKPQKEHDYISKAKKFADWWKKYDFTD